MTLTVDYRETTADRIKTDPAFASALMDEAMSLMLNGESEAAHLLLRDSLTGWKADLFVHVGRSYLG